jgi:hypothetical protein
LWKSGGDTSRIRSTGTAMTAKGVCCANIAAAPVAPLTWAVATASNAGNADDRRAVIIAAAA